MSNGWPRTLLVVEVVISVAAALGVLAGLLLVVSDLAEDSEYLDGLGTFLGLLGGGVSLLVLAVAAGFALLTRRALRSGDVGQRRLTGALPAGVAVLWLAGVGVAATQGAEVPPVALAVAAGLVVLVPAVGTIATSHPTV